MKVIFLDFDGVVVLPDLTFSKPAIERLNKIAKITNASICYSTSWIYTYNTQELTEFLHLNTLSTEIPIVGSIPKYDLCTWEDGIRAKAILEWLRNNPVESYVIIDDYAPINYPLGDRLVETNICIEEQHVKQAIEILETPLLT